MKPNRDHLPSNRRMQILNVISNCGNDESWRKRHRHTIGVNVGRWLTWWDFRYWDCQSTTADLLLAPWLAPHHPLLLPRSLPFFPPPLSPCSASLAIYKSRIRRIAARPSVFLSLGSAASHTYSRHQMTVSDNGTEMHKILPVMWQNPRADFD